MNELSVFVSTEMKLWNCCIPFLSIWLTYFGFSCIVGFFRHPRKSLVSENGMMIFFCLFMVAARFFIVSWLHDFKVKIFFVILFTV